MRPALVKHSVEDKEQTVRWEAARLLARLPDKHDALPQYVRYLGSKHSARAAIALRRAGLVRRLGTSEKPDPALTRR